MWDGKEDWFVRVRCLSPPVFNLALQRIGAKLKHQRAMEVVMKITGRIPW
jgi:hypothetical protein